MQKRHIQFLLNTIQRFLDLFKQMAVKSCKSRAWFPPCNVLNFFQYCKILQDIATLNGCRWGERFSSWFRPAIRTQFTVAHLDTLSIIEQILIELLMSFTYSHALVKMKSFGFPHSWNVYEENHIYSTNRPLQYVYVMKHRQVYNPVGIM